MQRHVTSSGRHRPTLTCKEKRDNGLIGVVINDDDDDDYYKRMRKVITESDIRIQ